MELWIAAYGSRKRVTVAKTVLVSPWLVLEVGGHYGEACLDWRLEHPRGGQSLSKAPGKTQKKSNVQLPARRRLPSEVVMARIVTLQRKSGTGFSCGWLGLSWAK